MDSADRIVAAIREGDLSTRDLVRISYALAARGANTTSVLGQYGEELVAAAYRGGRGSFDQKGYDVATASGEFLQVKTYTKGRRPGVIRSFGYDVVTVEVDPVTADVVVARRYLATELHRVFSAKWESKYRQINASFAAWGGDPTDRYERGWTIGSDVPYSDVTDLLVRAASRLGVPHEELATPARSHLPAATLQASD
jgi:hypothetical protein